MLLYLLTPNIKVKELEEQMKQRVADGEKQLEEFKKMSLEREAEEAAAAAAADGDQKPAGAAGGEIKKKKNQKPKTSSKKKGKGKK
jgi:hypothetical protein